MQLQHHAAGAEKIEIRVAVEQSKRVDRGGTVVAGVVGGLQVLARFVVQSQTHELNAQSGVRRPQLRVALQGFAVQRHGLFVTAVQNEVARGLGVGAAVMRVQALEPGVRRPVVEQRDDAVDREGAGAVGFLRRALEIQILQGEFGEQFVTFGQLGIELGRPFRPVPPPGGQMSRWPPAPVPAPLRHSSGRFPAPLRKASPRRRAGTAPGTAGPSAPVRSAFFGCRATAARKASLAACAD